MAGESSTQDLAVTKGLLQEEWISSLGVAIRTKIPMAYVSSFFSLLSIESLK
jgi:hypothetical protein